MATSRRRRSGSGGSGGPSRGRRHSGRRRSRRCSSSSSFASDSVDQARCTLSTSVLSHIRLLLCSLSLAMRASSRVAVLLKRVVAEPLLVAAFIFLWMIMPIVSIWFPIFVLCTRFWWTMPAYALWMYIDWDTSKRGARPLKFLRGLFLWRWFADYFPIRLIKTAELSPDRNYIVGSHPHGVLSIGAFTTFLSNGTGWDEKFPGVNPIILTLNGQFYFPFRREVGLLMGGAESSRESLEWLLANPGKGRAIGIVLGGLNESLMARPNTHNLKLRDRRGFCRFALKNGADLVPLYHFGENDVYDQHVGADEERLKNMQARIRNAIGFCPPLPRGCSLLGLGHGGIMPFRRPITSVMGAPIQVDRVENPTDLQVELLHTKYCEALEALFEKHKHLHNIPKHTHINFY